jgi:hypothetical protein
MANTDNDAVDWAAEELAELAQREAKLERLKLKIVEIERAGRYADARRTRQLLAEATESIAFTRMRLQRELPEIGLRRELPNRTLPATRAGRAAGRKRGRRKTA